MLSGIFRVIYFQGKFREWRRFPVTKWKLALKAGFTHVQGQLAFHLNFQFSGEVFTSFFCTMCSLVVFGASLTILKQTSKRGPGRGSTFFLLTFKAHGRNSWLIEVRGERMESRGQSRGIHGAALLKMSLGWAAPRRPGYYSIQGWFYAMHMLMIWDVFGM